MVRKVEVVSRISGPVGRARTAGLPGVVEKTQALLRSRSQAWGVSAKVWSQHGSDEILWTVLGVGKVVVDAEVVYHLKVCVESMVGTSEVVDWWVEDHLPRYVVVGGIPEENWAASGWEGVRRDNLDVAWDHRGPFVVGRVWGKLAVKLEMKDAAAVGAVVKSGVMVVARKFSAQLAIAAGGRGVQRGPAPVKGNAPTGGSAIGLASVRVVCYGCGKHGHLQRECCAGGGSGPAGRPPFRY